MKEGWVVKKLGEVCDFQGGSQPPKDEWISEPREGYIRMLQIRDFTQSRSADIEYVKITNRLKYCEKDDILLGRYGASVGKVLTGLSGAYNVAIMKTIPNHSLIEKPLLKYFLLSNSFQSFLQNASTMRAAQAGFSKEDIQDYPIPIPPLSLQSRIVLELDGIHSIIEKKREQLKQLDALAQSIFYDMFGDPIQNEKGWEVKKLGEVAEISSGGTPSRKNPDYFTGNINWYSAGELNSLYLPDSIEKITEQAIEESSAKIFKRNSLMVGMYDTAAFKMGILTKDAASNQACANVDLFSDNVVWLYYLLNLMKEEALKHRHGARQKNLNVGFIKSFPIPLPPLSLQQTFAAKIEAIEKQKELIKQSIVEVETLLASRMQFYFDA